ncbi:MAG: CPXCG motif-containing cysteine-rich protein [Colwelliaceae bacterium]|jgi:DNA-directed RNA polymerase subunit RPC12/RpoP|nr:CPXCG motif-containing cysteine-rich protein [Colwelliaceae bacterium]
MPQDSIPNKITDQKISCPHCGHHIFITLDPSAGDQDYYDECSACCKDIHLNMHIDEYRQKVQLAVDSDDEQVF